MKRIISLLAAMAIMAAMVVVMAMPAFAAQGRSGTAPNCEYGNETAYRAGFDHRNEQASNSLNKNYFGTDFNGNVKNPNAPSCI
jgi:hypothetical protein